MSLEAARRLSIPELFHVLGEKLDKEYSTVREIPPPFVFSEASLSPEIESLENRAHDILRLLRSLRNRLRPINRLPPEMISHIARCILRDYDADVGSIIPLTHVCQYWRDSIVSTPENWTLISSERRMLAELSLQRSKAAPLTIHLDLEILEIEPGFLDRLLPHIHNTVELSCIGFYSMPELIRALPNFPKSMPALQSLALTCSGQADWSDFIGPFDFSTHNTLRELSLSNIPLFPSILNLRTLTEFSLSDDEFETPVDTLLSFLEDNHSLESVHLEIQFVKPSLRRSRRQTPIESRLRRLSITGYDVDGMRTLISHITLRPGAALDIREYHQYDENIGLTQILSGISTTHLPNLLSPTFMEYQTSPRSIKLLGPNGSFSYDSHPDSEDLFAELPLLPLADVRELRLEPRGSWNLMRRFRLAFFPSLETLCIKYGSDISFLSHFSSDPTPPLPKTLAFLDCDTTGGFMAELMRVALDRENNSSAPLCRVVIINSKGHFPPVASIERLRKCVPMVEVLGGRKFPEDLS